MSEREIIAEAYRGMDLNAISADDAVNAILARLNVAGYRILGPDDLDAKTVERCARLMDDYADGKAHSAEVTLRDWCTLDIPAADRASKRPPPFSSLPRPGHDHRTRRHPHD